MPSLRRWFALILVAAAYLPWLSGCEQPVREDRTITWSAEGKVVGFQHGAGGVFVADPVSAKLTKIYQPGPDVLASSALLWSPAGDV